MRDRTPSSTYMKKIEAKILKGFRDYLPEKMILREKIINTVKEVYGRFGFAPMETPALEYTETLLGKYGEEADKLVYKFRDYGSRKVALRYDLTVPLARVIAMYPELPKPFKGYQIAPVWRAEKPQTGRFREFIQCDVDIVGTSSAMADAEIINVMYEAMKSLGFNNFVIQLNNRKILDGLISNSSPLTKGERSILEIDKRQSLAIFRILDKLEKIGVQKVKEELIENEIDKKRIKRILEFIRIKGTNQEILNKLKDLLLDNAEAAEGIKELELILDYTKVFDIPEKNLKINLSIVRGLDYYTGVVFETILLDYPKIGSVFSGGRYDNLMGMFLEKNIPAVGASLGVDRIFSAMETLKMFPDKTNVSKILVTVFNSSPLVKGEGFDKSCKIQSLKATQELRKLGINTEIYLEKGDFSKQFKYANKKNIPFVVIIGPKEIKENQITIKDLKSGEQKKIKRDSLKEILKPINIANNRTNFCEQTNEDSQANN